MIEENLRIVMAYKSSAIIETDENCSDVSKSRDHILSGLRPLIEPVNLSHSQVTHRHGVLRCYGRGQLRIGLTENEYFQLEMRSFNFAQSLRTSNATLIAKRRSLVIREYRS